MTSDTTATGRCLAPSTALLSELEDVYTDLHAHPELSMQEERTAGIAADWLESQGYEVTRGVGGTGVVGVLRNGDGPTVLLRADMDALPVEERTGLPYASTARGIDRFGQATAVTHACGHDLHTTWLMGVTRILAENRDAWSGTLLAVFQPGEETGQGAASMVADGLVERFPRPDIALGQHVSPGPVGTVSWRSGVAMSASDSWEITLHGVGAHGSSPELSVDSVVMAASTIMSLQTIRSREVGMSEQAVLTIGAVHSGSSENTIPDRAVLRLNVRTISDDVRDRVLSSVRRIVAAEAEGWRSPKEPEITELGVHPLTVNDEAATRKTVDALAGRLGAGAVVEGDIASASEDFGLFGTTWNVPSVFWFVGGTDPGVFEAAARTGRLSELPVNHSPLFAPAISPTLETGITAMLAAAMAWLGPAAEPTQPLTR